MAKRRSSKRIVVDPAYLLRHNNTRFRFSFARGKYGVRRDRFDPLEMPNYGYQEAVRYLHIPNSTLHYWLRPSMGLVTPPKRGFLSFRNMVELYVLKGLGEIHGVSLQQIRRAVGYLLQTFYSRHPLADFELKTDGCWVYFWDSKEYINVSLMGQIGIAPILDTYLKRVERDWQKTAAALYPFTRLEQIRTATEHAKVIVLNPNICSGKPVLAGTRITTAVLASRYLGGDSTETLAQSYDRPVGEIKEAVAWEIGKECAAA